MQPRNGFLMPTTQTLKGTNGKKRLPAFFIFYLFFYFQIPVFNMKSHSSTLLHSYTSGLLLLIFLLSGCSGTFNPNDTPEEPIIRGTGIVDRIYLASANPEMSSYCAIAFFGQSLVVTFDKELSFITYLWYNDKESLVQTQTHFDESIFSIDLSALADGTYTLYLNNICLSQFKVKEGYGVNIGYVGSEEEQERWVANDSLFFIVRFEYEAPEPDYVDGIYPLTGGEKEDWPFGSSVDVIEMDGNIAGVWTRRSFTLNPQLPSFSSPYLKFPFKFAKRYSMRFRTQIGDQPFEDLPCALAYDVNCGKYDFWEGEAHGVLLPNQFEEFREYTDEDGTTFTAAVLPVTLRPEVKPYQIEIIDPSCTMTSVNWMGGEGFMLKFGYYPKDSLDIQMRWSRRSGRYQFETTDILPVRRLQLDANTPAHVAAVLQRTWKMDAYEMEDGKLSSTPVILSFKASFEGGREEMYSVEVTDQFVARRYGGVIKIVLPQVAQKPSEDVNSFFATTLSEASVFASQRDTCHLVNSQAEMQELFAENVELPEIDFDRQTLLVGMVMRPSGYSLDNHYVYVKDDGPQVTLIIRRQIGTVVGANVPYYYWGLYDKLPSNKANLNVVIK